MLNDGEGVLQAACFETKHGELGVQRRDLLVGGAQNFDASLDGGNAVHGLPSINQEFSKQTSHHLNPLQKVFALGIQEL